MLDLNIYLFPGICGKLTNDSVVFQVSISKLHKSHKISDSLSYVLRGLRKVCKYATLLTLYTGSIGTHFKPLVINKSFYLGILKFRQICQCVLSYGHSQVEDYS